MRNSNIEMLRIFAMLGIVLFHSSAHGGFPLGTGKIFNDYFLILCGLFGKFGVDLFIIISGYFLIEQKFKIKNILKIILMYCMYTLILYVIINNYFPDSITGKDLFVGLLPIGMNSWFVHTYIILYLFFPYVNKFLKSLDKKETERLIILSTVIWYIIPSLLKIFSIYIPMENSNLLLFGYFYMLGGYIRLYCENIKFSNTGKYFFIVLLLGFGLSVMQFELSKNYQILEKSPLIWGDWNSIIPLILAVCIFLKFKQHDVYYNRIVNVIASTTLGIYIIHDNNFLRGWLWHYIFNVKQYYQSDYLCLYLIAIAIVIFLAGMIIDYIRLKIFKIFGY